ncbi:MAG: hypothetical protein EA367_10675 [Leptolyngbya sp. DLM2.Bin15]|nr:MAG: hypothetical protein EA367_10675 [Leptolyngbya sp. DLM2.Bin15]
MAATSLGVRLENYTLKYPQEVLMVHAQLGDDMDQIVIFRGFSSSLMHPTAYDPDVPVLSDQADITAIDRLQGPYDPSQPRYLQQGLTLDDMEQLMQAAGV